MKKMKRLFSVVCAAVLAVSGLSIVPGASSFSSITARAEDEYSVSVDGDTTFYLNDNYDHELTAEVLTADDVNVEDAGHTVEYAWSVETGKDVFKIVGETNQKTVTVKLTDEAAGVIGDKLYYDGSIYLVVKVDGTSTFEQYTSVRALTEAYYRYDAIELDETDYTYGNGYKSHTFELQGLEDFKSDEIFIDGDQICAVNVSDEYPDFDIQDYFTLDNKDKSKVTITLKDNADKKWAEFISGYPEGTFGDCLEAEYIFYIYPTKNPVKGTTQFLEKSVALHFYADNIENGLRLRKIDGPDVEDYYSPESGPRTYEAMFNMDELAKKKAISYEWTLEDDTAKYFEFVGSHNQKSVKIKPKSNILQILDGLLNFDGSISVSVKLGEYNDVTNCGIHFEATDVEFNYDQDFVFDKTHRTRSFTINGLEKYSGTFKYDYPDERDTVLGPQLYDIKISGNRAVVTLKDNADKLLESGKYAHYLDTDVQTGAKCYTVDTQWIFVIGKKENFIGWMTFTYYPEGVYDVTFTPKELAFIPGKAQDQQITAKIDKVTGKKVTYSWELDVTDKELNKCFSLINADKETVTIRYNGKTSTECFFWVHFEAKVDGKLINLSRTYVDFTLDCNEKADDDKEKPVEDKEKPGNTDEKHENPTGDTDKKQDKPGEDPKPANDSSENKQQSQSKALTASVGTVISGSESGVNGVYEVTSSDEGAATVRFKGASNKKAKKISIPGSIKDSNGIEYTVSELAGNAFKKNKYMKTLIMPSTIRKVGKNACKGCKKLSKITINGNNLKSIGKGAFSGIANGAKITVIAKNKKVYDKVVKMIKKSGAKGCTFKHKKG